MDKVEFYRQNDGSFVAEYRNIKYILNVEDGIWVLRYGLFGVSPSLYSVHVLYKSQMESTVALRQWFGAKGLSITIKRSQ